ncbi:MAG: hypothetical protein IJA47_01735 [Oscillospiraceae bacterium]|nr:hypothetical protein [Oscillospiraceae bacterium]
MANIRISDRTMKQTAEAFRLSFKEKIELSKLLDKLGADVIELEGISNARIDALRIKSIAAAVTNSTVAVPVPLCQEGIQQVYAALQQAKKPRLQVCAPVSSVQMEYLHHKKPDAMLDAIESTVAAAKALCSDVEFMADDATRADGEFLVKALQAAITAGATTVTLCDTAGTMLPGEFAAFIRGLYETLPALKDVTLGVSCVNTLSMADACAIAAAQEGVGELKVAAYPIDSASLANVARVLAAKGDCLDATCGVNVTQLSRIIDQIAWMCQTGKVSVQDATQEDTGIFLTTHDDISAVAKAVEKLGYDLSEEDVTKVYEAFTRIAGKKEQVSAKELDAIVASAAMQVPATYKLDTYVITSGNTISATAHMKLLKNGQPVEGVYMGDGSIDAAFKAIENITGCHYELDDFQLQAVTEGREAMGQTVVKLRAGGKVYSGRGISTDIVGAGIHAYLSALNKIVYEEDAE